MKAFLVPGLLLMSSFTWGQRAFENVRQKVEIIGPTSDSAEPVKEAAAVTKKKVIPVKANDVVRKQ